MFLIKEVKKMKTIRIALDRLLEQKAMTRYELAKRTGIQYHIVDNYYKNKVVRYDSYILLRICTVLDCGIEELIEISDEGEK